MPLPSKRGTYRRDRSDLGVWGVILLVVLVGAGWLTHIVNAIQDEQWVLLVVGALFFPVGIIHGIGIWIGLF